MHRIAAVLVLVLWPVSGALAAGAPSAAPGSAAFNWAVKCSRIPAAQIVVCRIAPDVEQGVVHRGPFVPVTFQVDNRDSRSVNIDAQLNCREVPAQLRFGDAPPFVFRDDDSLSGPVFDQVLAAFRTSKTGVVEYAPLPGCKPVAATLYFTNFDEALAKAMALVAGAGGS